MDQIFHNLTRREMLKTATCGFGGLALTGIHNGKASSPNSLVPKTSLFPQRAKRVIFIFMAGNPAMWILLTINRNYLHKMAKQIDFRWGSHRHIWKG